MNARNFSGIKIPVSTNLLDYAKRREEIQKSDARAGYHEELLKLDRKIAAIVHLELNMKGALK